MNDKIVKLIEERLEIGAKKYSAELNVHDGRDWKVETLEELLDACVYLSAGIIQIKENPIKAIKRVKIEENEVVLIITALEEMSSNLYLSGDNEKSTEYSELNSKLKKASNYDKN